MCRVSSLIVVFVALCLTLSAPHRALAAEPPLAEPAALELFERQIRPVLVERCQSCHGPKKQESGLRVDSRAALLKGGDNGAAIVPGKLDEGLLLEALRHSGSIQMPPDGKLTAPQIDAFGRWIAAGAPWPQSSTTATPTLAERAQKHWAFQPIADPPLPEVRDRSWPRDPLDYFILAKLESAGLTPASPAEPSVLLRRLSYDLLGLPPTIEQLTDLDASPNSPPPIHNPQSTIHNLIDSLLASPRYGERWARHWLDVARYADTKGYAIFGSSEFPWAYTYRDYVIRALNSDLPYDRFITEQLAADLIEPPVEPASLAALGFLTVGPRFIDNMHDIIDDRIDVVCRGLMGLTVGCARCHDHKFDPIASREYYGLYGVFASCVEPIVPPLVAPPPQTAGYVEFARELAAREQKLTDFVREKHTALVQSARDRAGEYLLAAHQQRGKPRQDDFMLISDANDLNPTMIRRWVAYVERARLRRDPVFVPWHRLAELSTTEWPQRCVAILEELQAAQNVSPVVSAIVARLQAERLTSLAEVAAVYGKMFTEVDQAWQQARQTNPHATRLDDPVQESLRQVLYAADAPPQMPYLPHGDLELIPDRKSQGTWRELLKAIEEFRATGPHAPPRAMSLVDLAEPRESRVFLRGNPLNLGEPAPRRFLACVSSVPGGEFTRGSGRLELARAIVDPRNPLTARVIVNRVWMHHFGEPLVRTPSDFGLQSEPPSHPELLDHLAMRFMRAGWSLKQLHRWIVGSATYGQIADCGLTIDSSQASNRQSSIENRQFFSPFPRRRLDLEQTRDALVSVSGRMDGSIGGVPVRGAFDAGGRRRSIYAWIDRYQLPGLMRAFDFPSPDSTNPRRDQTTVAPQALFWMNHPLVSSVASQILNRSELRGLDVPARIHFLHRLLYSRVANADELQLAQQFIGTGDPKAKWEQYVQALLMANEMVYLD